MIRRLLIVLLSILGVVFVANSQDSIYVDPMPKAVRDTLPKPLVILHIGKDCYPWVMGVDYITIGPNEQGCLEIWTAKEYAKLEKIWEAYNKAKMPRRKWVGDCGN